MDDIVIESTYTIFWQSFVQLQHGFQTCSKTILGGGPTFQDVGLGCCRDSAGLSPAYSYERLFKAWHYTLAESEANIAEMETVYQSFCLKEATCSGYQKPSCTTTWQEEHFEPLWSPAGWVSRCKVRYFCNSDHPNWLCNNLGDSGSANVVTAMSECGSNCMVQEPAPMSTTWTTTWMAVMTDAGEGTACAGGFVYFEQIDTTDLSYPQIAQACLDDPKCHAIAFRTVCEDYNMGSLLQASHQRSNASDYSCDGMDKKLVRYQVRYVDPGDGITLRGDGVAPAKDGLDGGRETQDDVWIDYFRCYVKVRMAQRDDLLMINIIVHGGIAIINHPPHNPYRGGSHYIIVYIIQE